MGRQNVYLVVTFLLLVQPVTALSYYMSHDYYCCKHLLDQTYIVPEGVECGYFDSSVELCTAVIKERDKDYQNALDTWDAQINPSSQEPFVVGIILFVLVGMIFWGIYFCKRPKKTKKR